MGEGERQSQRKKGTEGGKEKRQTKGKGAQKERGKPERWGYRESK